MIIGHGPSGKYLGTKEWSHDDCSLSCFKTLMAIKYDSIKCGAPYSIKLVV